MKILKKGTLRVNQPPSREIRIVPPYPNTYQFRVKAEFHGTSLLQMMKTRFPFNGRDVWEAKIRDGKIGVNGKEVIPEYELNSHDEVYHHNPNVIEPAVPDEVRVLHQTEDYLMVYKPAPLPMHPGGRFNKNSLTKILEERGFENLRIVHRLDSVTSGLVLFAKNKNFAQKAMRCFSESKVKKTYYALVSGIPEENSKTINSPIRRKKGFVFESKLGLSHAKEAVTQFEVIERRVDTAVIKCQPKTGRTHQIRLHLEHWGYPIVDDPIYGHHGDKSSRNAQKKAISLLNAGLEIEELGVNHTLELSEFRIQHSGF